MEKENDWKFFYENYRNIEGNNEEDLYFQVGKTINSAPISEQQFGLILNSITTNLKLNKNDTILELCCGNGLVTHPLSFFVKKIYAFDFTSRLIETAKKYKQTNTIFYTTGDAKDNFFDFFQFETIPNKFLMNDAMACFMPEDVASIVQKMLHIPFHFYITGVPNNDLKWKFYNTPERKEKYLKNVEKNDIFNEGMGRWFSEQEFIDIATKFNINIHIEKQWEGVANYRMNVLFFNH